MINKKNTWKAFSILFFLSCQQPIDIELKKNNPPQTQLWADSISKIVTSTIKLYWSGADPDGFVKGYFLTTNSKNWTWTTSTESTLTLMLGNKSLDTSNIKVSAADNEGNGIWDSKIEFGNILFGSEPFVDANKNGIYDFGESFTDIGLIDETPAQIKLVVKNSPPSVSFNISSTIPQITLPVATFDFKGTDPDGDATIKNYFVALNDTLNWTQLPTATSLITIVADLSDTSKNIVTAKILIGKKLEDLGITIPNFKLNNNNRLYIYCQDGTGAKSKIKNMPDSSKTWYVQKPKGRKKLLLVDEFGISSPDPDQVYYNILNLSLDKNGNTFSDYDVVELSTNPIPKTIANLMLVETFKMYKIVFWYGKVVNFDLAQQIIPEYVNKGGNVLLSTGFQNLSVAGIDPSQLSLDFAPIDSLITYYKSDTISISGFIPRVYSQSKILAVDSTSQNKFPQLIFDRTALFGTYALQNGFNENVLYRFDSAKATNPNNSEEKWIGKPAVITQSQNKKIIFSSIPLHLCNSLDSQNNPRLKLFFERIFKDEFGQ
ncbi:MAG: hypothetical protein O3A55_05665 [Bacteroidetes bacterium]|nr:hypothetical protein [Bacteroidota bacterium]